MPARRRRCSSWSHFLPELLGLVLHRLASLADRVRLRAVCRAWRDHARLEPLPPPLPWLALLDGTFLSVADGGEVHRLPVPDDALRCHGSVGNWLFIEHHAGRCSLTNPFTKAAVRLPKVHTIWHHEEKDVRPRFPIYLKLVLLSSLPDPSPRSLFNVLTLDNERSTHISICQPPMASTSRVPNHGRMCFLDVTFFDGKLYALTGEKQLFALEIDPADWKGKAEIPPMNCVLDSNVDPGTVFQSFVDKGYECKYWGYLVESSGRLLHVRRMIGVLSSVPEKSRGVEHLRTLSFDIFEADLTTTSGGQWKRVSTLGGQALFVGTHSKSLPAAECGAQQDCIYFMRDYDRGNTDLDPFHDCGVFNMRNGMITPLLPETTVMAPQGEAGRPAWFFPVEA